MARKKVQQQKKTWFGDRLVCLSQDHMTLLFVVVCNIVVLGASIMLYVTKQDIDASVERMNASVAMIQHMYSLDTMQARKLAVELYGYPMAQMVPYLVREDPQVAAFLVAIAKKESAWGKRAPVLNGDDCYNYWGFRQVRTRMGTGGHTCFDSPQDAVRTVAARVQELIAGKHDTPQKMVVVWKCGSSCQGHTDASVSKWVADVNYYYTRVYRRP